MKAIVTLRLKKFPNHDPKNKVIDFCPLSNNIALCTDVTGEHHSYLETGENLGEIKEKAKKKFPLALHITRIEVVP